MPTATAFCTASFAYWARAFRAELLRPLAFVRASRVRLPCSLSRLITKGIPSAYFSSSAIIARNVPTSYLSTNSARRIFPKFRARVWLKESKKMLWVRLTPNVRRYFAPSLGSMPFAFTIRRRAYKAPSSAVSHPPILATFSPLVFTWYITRPRSARLGVFCVVFIFSQFIGGFVALTYYDAKGVPKCRKVEKYIRFLFRSIQFFDSEKGTALKTNAQSLGQKKGRTFLVRPIA